MKRSDDRHVAANGLQRDLSNREGARHRRRCLECTITGASIDLGHRQEHEVNEPRGEPGLANLSVDPRPGRCGALASSRWVIMDVYEAVMSRRAVRGFTDQHVPR